MGLSPVTQQNLPAAVTTPLGDDVLVLKGFHIEEGVGSLFLMRLDLVSADHRIAFDDIVGQVVTVRLETVTGENRYWNGYVARFAQLPSLGGFACYQAEVRPWLWFLTQAQDCRIFQEKSVPDIIEEVFGEHSFDRYELRLSGTYDPREYCVQYRESDFAFVSRLMEEVGIYYYFEHSDGDHLMVLADAPSAHVACPGGDTIDYGSARSGDPFTGAKRITSWLFEKNVLTTAYTLQHFDFETPSNDLLSSSQVDRSHGQTGFERYDYPGRHLDTSKGEADARVRVEEIQARHELYRGEGTARNLAPGFTFTLAEHYRSDYNKTYLLLNVIHTYDSGRFRASEDAAVSLYQASMEAIPASTPYRAPSTTPKPVIPGTQTAIVVGPDGEEIHTDEHGRCKVHFHWDRDGQKNENDSCWIRISEGWAGAQWGAIYLPRIGQEVIVSFLEGDPDRPLVTGRVYNGENMPPYALPAEKTKSTLKSRSTTEGGNDNFNEIRFEDKIGEEEFYVQAEKDMNILVKNDRGKEVQNNETNIIKVDRTTTIQEGNETLTVSQGNRTVEVTAGDETHTVGGTRTVDVTGDVTYTDGANLSRDVTGDRALTVGGNDEATITGNQKTTISGNQDVTVSGNYTLTVSGNLTINCSGNLMIKGMATTTKSDGAMTINAGGALTQSAGAAMTFAAASAINSKGASHILEGALINLKGALKIG